MNPTQEDTATYAPTLVLTRHTGALLMYFQQDYTYRGDPMQLKPALLMITLKNFLFGWWSIRSIVINPFVIIYNIVRYFRYKKAYARFMANPNQYIFEMKSKNAKK